MAIKTDAEFALELKRLNEKRKQAANERKLAYAECIALLIKSGDIDGKAINDALRAGVKSKKHRALLELDKVTPSTGSAPPPLPSESANTNLR